MSDSCGGLLELINLTLGLLSDVLNKGQLARWEFHVDTSHCLLQLLCDCACMCTGMHGQ